MLTTRQEQLLRFIVDDYVRTAQPVASANVVRRSGLPVSSATIRHEMSRLEEEGYIVQPHTSAGRVPSDSGYRYYVEALMRPRELPEPVRQTIRHQFHQTSGDALEWARLAAAVLAARLSYAAVVTAPRASVPRLRWVQLVSLQDYLALLLLVLEGALVMQQTVPLDRPVSQDELSAAAARLNSLYSGRSAEEVRSGQVEHPNVEAAAVGAALELMESAEVESLGEPYLEGLAGMLREPEFAEGERILELLSLFEQPNLRNAIPVARGEEQVTVVIGSENRQDAMQQCSVIVSSYGGGAGLRGTISVLGPTRMHYSRAVSMVRYMNSVMEELLDSYFN